MWRAFFLAIGVSLIILGAECMVVEKVVFLQPPREGGMLAAIAAVTSTGNSSGKTYAPPDWSPWSLFSAGAVVMIYSFTIPKRVTNE